jgi:hypothetical protein
MSKLFLFIFLFSSTLFGTDVFWEYDRINAQPIFKYKGIRISHSQCYQKKCQAKDVIVSTNKDLLKKVYVGPNGVNPTSPFCRALNGKPTIFYLQNRDAVSICIFKDRSFLLSWDLYNLIL